MSNGAAGNGANQSGYAASAAQVATTNNLNNANNFGPLSLENSFKDKAAGNNKVPGITSNSYAFMNQS